MLNANSEFTHLRDIMKTLDKIAGAIALCGCVIWGRAAPRATDQAPATPRSNKNWTAPRHKIYAQTLSDDIMTKHPELISVTFHGVPPGMNRVYTMFAGSFPERIGNADDPDDIDVTTKGITILDPRWHRTSDPERKFVVLMPLRDASMENVGLIVFAFKNPENSVKSEREYLAEATVMRDGLQPRIPSYKALFDAVK
jgi:hypothetical protein